MVVRVDEVKGRFNETEIDEEETEELNKFIQKIKNNEFPKEFYGQTRDGKLVFVKKFDKQKRGIILKDIKTQKIIGYYLGGSHDEYMSYLKRIK